MITDSSTAVAEPIARGSLRAQVTARLLRSVFEGRFHAGQRLIVQRLAEQLGVSPTPVREALVELASLGMVELLPNRGAVVRPFGPQEVLEICQVRRVLETEAARCAAGRIAPAEIADQVTTLSQLRRRERDAGWGRESRLADSRLHDAVARYCGSHRLESEILRYKMIYRSMRDVVHQRFEARSAYGRIHDDEEHLAIATALQAGDADRAAAAMAHHLTLAVDNLQEGLFAVGGNHS